MSGEKDQIIVLVAEENEGLAALIHSNLVNTGFAVQHAADAADVLQKAGDIRPGLIIFSMMLPGMPGKEVLRTIKSTPAISSIPVIALSEQSEEIDRVVALELGADDYVSKPFSARELALRVRAILSRRAVAQPRPTQMTVGGLKLDSENRSLAVNGKPVDLSTLDFRLLSTLMNAHGGVISREQLIAAVWGPESEISPRAVDTQLRRLRAKLGPAGDQIETVRGFGYRLSK